MIFRENRNLKSFISKLLFGIYFLALFSQSFHHHDPADIFKGFNLKKTENAMKEAVAKNKAGDCLACHFLATGNTLVPEEFSLTFDHVSCESELLIAIQERLWKQTKFTFRLRGPPSVS